MRRFSIFVLFFLLLMPVVMSVSNLTPLVHATTYNTLVDISSPIENKTYFTNDIPLSFNYSTDIIDSSEFGESHGVVFVYNVDGEVIFSVYGQAFFLGGKTTRIGQFYEPVPSDYSLYIDVPNGKHSVIVMVTFWFMREGELISIERISQTVNFTVSAEPPIPSESTIYIRADGSVEGTDKIQRNGNVYTFLGNISIEVSGVDGIRIERDNIVIDGAGYCLKHLEKPTGYTSEDGIVVQRQNNVTITNVAVYNFFYGISVKESSNIIITKTTTANNYWAYYVLGSHNDSIIDNQIINNNHGIELHSAENNKVDGNSIVANYFNGLRVVNSSENIVSNNYIAKNSRGIYINYGGENRIFGNTIAENSGWGIQLRSSNSSRNNNVFYHNNFINNQVSEGLQVSNQWYFGPESNIWDNGEEGNYWSDYTTRYPNATEIDDSGIGNTPFVINEYNIDHYPIIETIPVIPEFPSWTPLLVTLVAVLFVAVVYSKRLAK